MNKTRYLEVLKEIKELEMHSVILRGMIKHTQRHTSVSEHKQMQIERNCIQDMIRMRLELRACMKYHYKYTKWFTK